MQKEREDGEKKNETKEVFWLWFCLIASRLNVAFYM